MNKLIRDMNYLELDKFLNQDIKITENQLTQLSKHKRIDDIHFWGRSGIIAEYTASITKDNGNPYSDVDIFVRED